MAKGLVTAGSCLVSQNPAGWLRRAIEEDYSPPRTYERHRQRHAREKKDIKPVQAAPRAASDAAREPQMAEEESRKVQTATEPEQTVSTERVQNVAAHTRENIPEKTARENETTWNKALEQLQADLPREEVAARFAGTTLFEVTDTAARIGVPNLTALVWLERRMYGQISKAIKGVLGKDLDLQFVAAS